MTNTKTRYELTMTATGRPVDAVILPVSPYAAFKPGEFQYSGTLNEKAIQERITS